MLLHSLFEKRGLVKDRLRNVADRSAVCEQRRYALG